MKQHFLDHSDLGGNVKSIAVLVDTNERLLLTVRTDEGVNLDGLNVVQFLYGVLDLNLVASSVNNENHGVGVLNLLHRGLSGKWASDD